MRLLVDENVSSTVIRALRERGHDVVSVKEALRGADDASILARAQAEGRLVVTHDKDFGELAFRAGLPATSGIVLFRLAGTSPAEDSRRVIEVLESGIEWVGQFAVVTNDRIRTRPLPGRREKPR